MKTRILKLIIFFALIAGFYAMNGFERPIVPQEDYRSSARVQRAWMITVCIFLLGSVLAVWGNTIAQQVDWDVPEGLYPTLGVLLLAGGAVWMWMVRSSIQPS